MSVEQLPFPDAPFPDLCDPLVRVKVSAELSAFLDWARTAILELSATNEQHRLRQDSAEAEIRERLAALEVSCAQANDRGLFTLSDTLDVTSFPAGVPDRAMGNLQDSLKAGLEETSRFEARLNNVHDRLADLALEIQSSRETQDSSSQRLANEAAVAAARAAEDSALALRRLEELSTRLEAVVGASAGSIHSKRAEDPMPAAGAALVATAQQPQTTLAIADLAEARASIELLHREVAQLGKHIEEISVLRAELQKVKEIAASASKAALPEGAEAGKNFVRNEVDDDVISLRLRADTIEQQVAGMHALLSSRLDSSASHATAVHSQVSHLRGGIGTGVVETNRLGANEGEDDIIALRLRADSIEQQMDEIHALLGSRLNSSANPPSEVDPQIDDVRRYLGAMSSKLDQSLSHGDAIDTQIDTLRGSLELLSLRLDEFGNRVDAIDDLRSSIDMVRGKLSRVEQEEGTRDAQTQLSPSNRGFTFAGGNTETSQTDLGARPGAALAAAQAPADELAQGFEQHESEERDNGHGERIAALEGRFEALATTLDGIIKHQKQVATSNLPERSPRPLDSPEASPSGRRMSRRDSFTNNIGATVMNLSQQVSVLTGELERVSRQIAFDQKQKLEKSKLSEEELQELDARSESRLGAVWTELTQHSKAAAVRADALERALVERLDKHDGFLAKLSKEAKATTTAKERNDKALATIEWLTWRISWLEWATSGEKRSFARPVDAKNILTAPPHTVLATSFSQPMTEDMELWAKEPHGKLRLRRDPIVLRRPVTQASAEPPSLALAGAPALSRSTGRLPQLA